MQKILLSFGFTLITASLFFLNYTSTNTDIIQIKFNHFKDKFGKVYKPEQELFRSQVYSKNVAIIQAHNANPTKTYTMTENQFADLTDQEFTAIYLTATPINDSDIQWSQNDDIDENIDKDIVEISNVDWRSKLYVKNQGACGSCWAFSAVGTIEGFLYITQNNNFNLSEQQLVDCDTYSHGCSGGSPQMGIYWASKHGLKYESQYPYQAKDQICKYSSGPVKPNGVQKIGQSAGDLRVAVYKYPAAVLLDATEWKFYESGIFTPSKTTLTYNHAVIVAGYYSDGVWLVKNSWGLTWGEGGYIRLAPGNTCGIYTYASKPI